MTKNFKIIFALSACLTAISAYGEIPSGYYTAIDGKGGDALVASISGLSEGHTVVKYGDETTWAAFVNTDVRIFNGQRIWWDMYSNKIVPVGDGSAPSGMNKEHCVPNSWWGGKSEVEPYSDLFELNPSESTANGQKSNYPPGEVANTDLLDNGMLKVGSPKAGQGGGSARVFEPADEYKGDFARTYFYMFSTYYDIPWKSDYAYIYDADNRLQEWSAELLLRWHREDPVDSRELNRNEEVYKLQGNRNPFIDYPELAEYIWGDKKAATVTLSALTPATAVNRPAAPTFPGSLAVAVNGYQKDWWDGFTQQIDFDGGTLKVSLDGRNYYEPANPEVQFDPATKSGDTHVVKAYVTGKVGEYTLNSSVATLQLLAKDPSETDYTTARWEKMTADNKPERLDEDLWVILSSSDNAVMSYNGGDTKSKFMMVATGAATFDKNGIIVLLPNDAAIVEFEADGAGDYKLLVNDTRGNYVGTYNTTAAKSMTLKETSTTTGTWQGINGEDEFVFTFGSYGTLQYNNQSPRFLNYTSAQKPVNIYRLLDMNGGLSGLDGTLGEPEWSVTADGMNLRVPEGAVIFDLNGRAVQGEQLGRGVYIVVFNGSSRKVML